jgi:hypothetical protein
MASTALVSADVAQLVERRPEEAEVGGFESLTGALMVRGPTVGLVTVNHPLRHSRFDSCLANERDVTMNAHKRIVRVIALAGLATALGLVAWAASPLRPHAPDQVQYVTCPYADSARVTRVSR